MLKKYQQRFSAGSTIPTLKQQGYADHTWTANSFLPMLYQTLTVTITEQIAEMVKIRRRDAISAHASEPLRRSTLRSLEEDVNCFFKNSISAFLPL